MNLPVTKKFLTISGTTLAVVVAALLLFKFVHKAEKEYISAPKPIDLEVVAVTTKNLERKDQLPGEVQAYQDVQIYPKVPGFVKWIGIDRGSIVKAGQLMVTMYAPEYVSRKNEAMAKVAAAKSQLSEAESRLESARATWSQARAKLLGDDSTYQRLKSASLVPGVVATNDVIVLGQQVDADREAVKTWSKNIEAAENQVAALKDSLHAAEHARNDTEEFASYLNITAPFDGYITDRNMHVGSFVGPLGNGAYPAIARIAQVNLLRIVAPVPERDVAGVVPGAQVEFTVSAQPGKKFVGTVARLGNYLEQKTRTMPVELNYYNSDMAILPGMFCEIYWPTHRQQPSMFVPSSAVVTTTLETFVCKVDKRNEIKWVRVHKGQGMGNLVEVFGDVLPGDLIAKNASDELQPGTEVKPILISQAQDATPSPPRGADHLPPQ